MKTICIYFYSIEGKSLNSKVPDFDINNFRFLQIYNDRNEITHEYFRCGKIKPIAKFPAFSYYIENDTNFHIFISDHISYKYEHYPKIGLFLQNILNIHIANQSVRLNLFLPNIATAYTKLSFGSRLLSEQDFLKYISHSVSVY